MPLSRPGIDGARIAGTGWNPVPGMTTMSSTTGQPSERRVLYVISRYTYRSTFIVREIEELAARGWTIAVVSLRPPIFSPGHPPADLPYAVTYDPFLAAPVLRSAIAALATAPRLVLEYVRLM